MPPKKRLERTAGKRRTCLLSMALDWVRLTVCGFRASLLFGLGDIVWVDACKAHGVDALQRGGILLLRHSGLRIQDVACLERARLNDDKLFLYTQKTGTPVYCPLPPGVVEALKGQQNDTPEYFFWDGKSERETTVKSWNRVFQKLFATCDPPIVGGHPHRFRDTFAISLLLRGAELPNVSILLGHSSIRVTERHYSPWIKARQEQLEADVRRTWAGISADAKTKPRAKRRNRRR